MTRTILIAVAALLVAGTSSAPAATVSLAFGDAGDYPDAPSADTLTFAAAAGETNHVTVTRQGRALTVRDSAAPLTAGDACTSDDAHHAHCLLIGAVDEPDVIAAATVDLGDGNDTIDLGDSFDATSVTGGDGNDTITTGRSRDSIEAGAGNDTISSGAGRDDLFGSEGRDVLRAGPGDDSLDDGDAGRDIADASGATTHIAPRVDADVLDGGPGEDAITYEERRRGVHVDLSRPSAPAGEKGEGDRVSAIEEVYGSDRGHNVLVGNSHHNRLIGESDDGSVILGGGGSDQLEGGPGNDRVEGGPGNDVIDTQGGDDVLDGGAGNDTLSAGYTRGDKPDVYRGGPGNDRLNAAGDFGGARDADHLHCDSGRDVIVPDAYDVVPADCERVGLGDDDPKLFLNSQPAAVTTATATFDVPCPISYARAKAAPCHGFVTLQAAGGATLGRHGYRVRVGHQQRLTIKLTGAGSRLARRGAAVRVRISMTVRRHDAEGDERLTAAYTIRLAAAR